MNHFDEAGTMCPNPVAGVQQQQQQQQQTMTASSYATGSSGGSSGSNGSSQLGFINPVTNYHPVYNTPGGTNFFMHKYGYNPRLLFDNLQNMVEKTSSTYAPEAGGGAESTQGAAVRAASLGDRQSSLDNLTLINPQLDQQLQQDLARIKLNDIESSSNSSKTQTTRSSANTNQIDDLNRIEIDSNSVSILNDMNDELMLAIINDSNNISTQKETQPPNSMLIQIALLSLFIQMIRKFIYLFLFVLVENSIFTNYQLEQIAQLKNEFSGGQQMDENNNELNNPNRQDMFFEDNDLMQIPLSSQSARLQRQHSAYDELESPAKKLTDLLAGGNAYDHSPSNPNSPSPLSPAYSTSAPSTIFYHPTPHFPSPNHHQHHHHHNHYTQFRPHQIQVNYYNGK